MLAAYVVFVIAVFPEYLELIPAYQLSWAYQSKLQTLVSTSGTALWLLTVVVLAVGRLRDRETEAIRVLFVAATGFLAEAMIQRKGWAYHFYPVTVLAVSALATRVVQLGEQVRGARARRLRLVPAAVLSVLMMWRSAAPLLSAEEEDSTVVGMIELIRQYPRGVPIYVMSSMIYPAFPVVNYSGASWSGRFPLLWFLPGFYLNERRVNAVPFPYTPLDQMSPLERTFFDSVITDLLRNPPVLLFVQSAPSKQAFGQTSFDFLEYYSRDARVATLLRDYEHATRIDEFIVHRRRGL